MKVFAAIADAETPRTLPVFDLHSRLRHRIESPPQDTVAVGFWAGGAEVQFVGIVPVAAYVTTIGISFLRLSGGLLLLLFDAAVLIHFGLGL